MKRLVFTLTWVVLITVAFAFAAENSSLQATKPERVKAATAKPRVR